MGRKCAVPHCYTGYRKCKEKASLYRVPDDDFFLTKWQEAIARDDRPITPKDYVCEKHFKDDDILKRRIIKDVVEEYQRPRLKPDAIPSIFPDLPEFILKMVKKRRKMPVESPNSEIDDTSTSKGDDKAETKNAEDKAIEEIKIEPSEEDSTLSTARSENILSNEIDIKSEPEENFTEDIEENEEGNDKDDPCYGQKMHQCDQCEYKTKYAHNLRTHKTKHLTGEEAYLHCKYCPNYKTKWELTFRNHLKIKHGIGKQEVFKCTICQFETKVKLCLKRHYERHNRGIVDKKFTCTFPGCDFENESKTLLNMHIKLHEEVNLSGELGEDKQKSFKCNECLYATNSKTHIIRHIKSAHNTGDDTIVSINNNSNNILIPVEQDKIKPKNKATLKCLKCPYKSVSQENLLKHVFKHKFPEPTVPKELKAKIWKCPKCPYATFFQHALKKHRQQECEKEVYLCANCNYKSCLKHDYIKHMLTHGNVTIESLNQSQIVSGEAERLCIEPDIQECHETIHNDGPKGQFAEQNVQMGDNLKKIVDIKQEESECRSKIGEFVVVKVEEEDYSHNLD